jgi:hypothetical protein
MFAINNIFRGVFYYEPIVVVYFCFPTDEFRGDWYPIAKLKKGNHYFGIGQLCFSEFNNVVGERGKGNGARILYFGMGILGFGYENIL